MLVLRQGDLELIMRHTRTAAPEECCGVLGGRVEGEARRVEVVHPCRNVAPRPRWEYLADPQDQLDAFLDIEDARGLEVLGVYHSHPQGPPGPSAVDAARAAYPGASYFLVWLAPTEGWASWQWTPEGFVREALAVRG